jgi:AcrR family transcriptional regulator
MAQYLALTGDNPISESLPLWIRSQLMSSSDRLAAVGLREMKTARTREHIVEVAIELFLAQGYDQTTMEQIAEKAEVAPSTLYRYFATKDLLVLDRLLVFTDLGAALAARPADEPVGESLAVILQDSLESVVDDPRHPALQKVIDETPALRSRFSDIGIASVSTLERTLADRLALAPDDVRVFMTARNVLLVFEIAATRWWSGDHSHSRADVLDDILTTLAAQELILPTPLDR